MTLGPAIATLGAWGLVAMIWPWSKMLQLKAAIAAVWLYAGKFVILAPSLAGSDELTSGEPAALVTWKDTSTAIFFWVYL